MGYNARNDEIHENLERMRREREAYEDALAIVRQFNARLSAKKTAWFWPTIGAALASKHHWLRPRSHREAVRPGCTDPRCAQRCSVPALQRSRQDSDRRPLAVSVSLDCRQLDLVSGVLEGLHHLKRAPSAAPTSGS